MVKRRCSPPEGPGITISERACGLAEASIEPRVPILVLLSLLLSISVFSPLTAGLLVRPLDGLAEEAPDSGWGLTASVLGVGSAACTGACAGDCTGACAETCTGPCTGACAAAGFGASLACMAGPGILPFSLQFAGVSGTGPGMLSPSLQFAGVKGTGPKADIPLGGGLRVGGEMTGSVPAGIRWTL